MKTTTRLLLLAVLALPVLAACKKDEGTQTAQTSKPAVAKPASPTDENAWNAYITDQVTRHLEGATSTFAYTLPAPGSEGYDDSFQRAVDKAKEDVSRGGVEGTLMAFGSADSAKTADMIVAAFNGAGVDTMKGVRVLFIGDAADKDRAEAAVKPSGAKFEFAEAK
ncbi:hypothetical protein DWG18_07015 [Lysobacter sp. TY2-98]|uniref:hypothetical protein n=1 Tax=Lysobacter sp. TY2-98 TaxID=2290922 RepID=UPI000E204118|nr:hypothetical protein [Lysobacter sp. TY2-98]AXK72056.1 hypothetical protein DWG18_07015 [Lysobacter sp. TY2-98]